MERIADNTFSTVTNNDQMTFFITQFLKTDMLESPEERKYHDRALEIIEYFVIQTMLMRIVLSMIQTIIARIASKIKLSKVDDAERKAKASTDVLIKFFRNFVENKFGNEVGKYLSTYVEDYYQSTQDQKEQFVKFENLVNVLIGIK
jgi:F0F1-type ATP synthase membrane subunit a